MPTHHLHDFFFQASPELTNNLNSTNPGWQPYCCMACWGDKIQSWSSLQAWTWCQILYNLSECLNKQSAIYFVVFLSDGSPHLKDGSDLVQNVRGFEVLKIPWGQEIFFQHSISSMTLLFSTSKTLAVVLACFAKILFQLLIRKRYMNFCWNIDRDWGKAAWLKGEQAHDGGYGLLRNFHVREAALHVISIYIYWDEAEDREELQEPKGN